MHWLKINGWIYLAKDDIYVDIACDKYDAAEFTTRLDHIFISSYKIIDNSYIL